jgi:hypothetical protein
MGISGVLRTVKFVKYFPRFDWEPYVVTMTPRTYFSRDESLLDEVRQSNVKIFRTHCRGKKNLLNDHKLKRLPNEGRRKFFTRFKQFYKLPDVQKSWKKKGFKLASQIIENEKIDLIFATAPPFTDFMIASDLKKKYGIPLVIDYRDSWLHSASNFYPTPYHKHNILKKEAEVLRTADEIFTINRRIKEHIIESYENLSHQDVNVIPHGFDQEDFDSATSQLPRTNKMRFTYAGSFFDLITPKYFFEALAIAIVKRPEIKKRIESCFLGVLSRENLHLISKLNLTEVVYNPGYVNHRECIKYLLASDVLWFMIGNGRGSDIISTIKLYEYFGARKPILACVPDGVAKGSLRNHDAVKICEPDKPESIAANILEYYDLFSQNKLPIPNEDFINKFSAEKLSHLLIRYFEFLIDISPHAHLISNKNITNPI